jgi:hypothetical protein
MYSPLYPANTKTITIDLVSRIPVGEGGDEKYVLSISVGTNVKDADGNSISAVYIYNMKRGWAQSHSTSFPLTTAGGTVTVAIDEADSGAVTLTLESGTFSSQTLTQELQNQLRATASGSGAKASASNMLSYLNSEVTVEDNMLTFLSGSTKKSYNSSTWSETSSVKVTGGTIADALGFYTGYPNSYDLATTTSGYLHGPASAHVTIDDAVRFAIMSIANQVDFSS